MTKQYWIALGIFVVVGVALYAVLTTFVAPIASANQTLPADPDAATMLVAKGLYCPVCPNTPLDVCDTQACAQWRDLIKQKIESGETQSQIQAYFVQQYGERVLGAPRVQGFNIFIYVLPALAVAAGAAILYLFAQRRVRPAPVTLDESPTAVEYRSRIERELKENE